MDKILRNEPTCCGHHLRFLIFVLDLHIKSLCYSQPVIYNRSAQSRSWRSQSKGEQAEYRKYFSMALSL
uniref:Uncharacterized protein n=1 Tax=Vibrio tasmaniensis TaxID=212663 RepID=A0A0H3ZN79_9VIBR|nr:hypothetical protein [Vibrio tasmaniensis]